MPRVLYSSTLTKVLRNTVIRLLSYLSHPVDGRMLGPQLVREIIYRILTGEHGDVLRLLAIRHGRFGQMAKVLLRIHNDFNTKLEIETLAAEANMSVSSFHSNFKAVTNTSPIQYIKKLRLQKARILMVQDDLNAIDAATKVGYESASQFNREFKRYFGNTPVDEAVRMRNTYTIQ
jgi:AraC-like DNA-binding protein